MKTKLLLLLLLANFSIYAQYTAIPDINFERKLIELGIDSGAEDGQVLTASISQVKGLDVRASGISDLTGIEGFISLQTFICRDNSLTSLNLSQNKQLFDLDCANNLLQTLDVSENTLLYYFNCMNNDITTLDVTKNIKLQELVIGGNPISDIDLSTNKDLRRLAIFYSKFTTLDVSNNTGLADLDFSGNQITNIDLSNNVNLTDLVCSSNLLTNLDLSQNRSLVKLNCSYNKLSSLNISNNVVIKNLDCSSNKITSLDVSKNLVLNNLTCSGNKITTLDLSKNLVLASVSAGSNNLLNVNLKSGKNSLLTSVHLLSNPSLTCVQVDDAVYSASKWNSNVDSGVTFSTDCNQYTSISDPVFENKLIDLGIDTDGLNGLVLNSNINTLTTLNVSNSAIKDLSGIEGFVALTELNVSKNQLTQLDLSNNTILNTLTAFENTGLNCIKVADVAVTKTWSASLDQNTIFNVDCNVYTLIPDSKFEEKLIELGFDNDGLNGKVLTQNIASVTTLNVSNSEIKDLTGIEDFTALRDFNCKLNPIQSLDLSKNTNLVVLSCGGNSGHPASGGNGKLTSLDLSKNTKLTTLNCSYNQISSLNLSGCTELNRIECSINRLTTINFPSAKLTQLDCSGNPLTSLDVSNLPNLNYLNVYYTTLKKLDVSKNPVLTSLTFSNSPKLEKVNFRNGNNKNFVVGLYTSNTFTNCPNLTCIAVDDVAYSELNWSHLKDATAAFNTECIDYTLIPDLNFEKKLIALGIDTDGENGKVATPNIASLTMLNVSKSNISDLTGIQDFAALTILNASENTLATVDVSSNVNLKTLNLGKNKLTTLDTSNNTFLESVTVSNNSIAALNFHANPALIRIYATDNLLTSLAVSLNTNLTTLWCQRNKLQNLDVSQNLALTEFTCGRNELTELNVSKNVSLATLSCGENKIKNLDVSSNKLLVLLDCSINKLESLNLKNGTNNLIDKTYLKLFSNLSLKCILIDDVEYANTNWSTVKDPSASFNIDCTVYTLIPDLNFEKKLISLGIDKDGENGKVATTSIEGVTSLDVSNSLIADLTGIQDFTSLTYLNCSANTLTNLDLSKNAVLENLQAYKNQLTTFNTNANKSLTTLSIGNNKLTSLEVSASTMLENLNVGSNTLTSLNVSANTALTILNCGNNKLTALDVKSNSSLNNLYCHYNQITSLDVSQNILLAELMCHGNQLKELNVENNPELSLLDCLENQITSIDISKNPKITELACENNQLTSLNLKNGNNRNLILTFSNFINNPNLTCILVDDVAYSDSNWSALKDTTASYSADCTVYTLIPDVNFEAKLIALGIDKDGPNGKVATASISSVISLNISESNISDLTGLEDFNSLTTLNCSSNEIAVLNLTLNSTLVQVNCNNNKLTSLATDKNDKLTTIDCSYNTITSLDLSKNPALTAVNVSNNNLNSLNLKNGFNINMDWFSVNFTKNPALTCIQVDNAQYSNDNWNGKLDKTAFFTENCGSYTLIPDSNFEDKLIQLKIDIDGKNGKVLTSTIASIKDLNVQLSDIKDLTGIQDFTSLEFLNCQFNLLTTLNVAKNSNLIELYTHGNDLTTLDVSANTALTTLQVNKNKLTALDISKNSKLEYINVMENQLKILNLNNGNNINFTGALLSLNSTLSCIKVDNPSFAASSSVFFKDTAATYSATCTLGIEDSVFSKATLYPNPTKGEVNINNVSLEKATVYNSLGQLVKTFVFNNGETNNLINLSGLPRGVYYVYLINGDAASAKKIIVE
ncbi:T9SS type A sorting domain-containing protein [Flavobacterium sp. ACN6]|uniref:T9SS type A sorting domain-containing protein n=1 Tax=Flavobacterium sp. ACN6 TaxID=1920426 RepID=UPI000BB3BF02|nr:T9SS type A sorting domain-containing protein [Flavobacterium sp. ACN6]PBJ11433.1 Internalin-J precursor [Flavobacterium sp. ACN6]